MPPKKKVSAKLRKELSEYASLVRALHVTSTQDIIPHLTGSFPAPGAAVPTTEDTDAVMHAIDLRPDDENMHSPGQEGQSDINEEEEHTSKQKKPSQRPSRAHKYQRDQWSRWPMLRDHIFVPEWSLQDEVQAIAERKFGKRTQQEPLINKEAHHQAPTVSDEERDSVEEQLDEMSTDDELDQNLESLGEEKSYLPTGVARGLALESDFLLQRIFATLGAHRYCVAPAVQTRLFPMDWKAVFMALNATGVVDEQTLRVCYEKMERLHESEEQADIFHHERREQRMQHRLKELEKSIGPGIDTLHLCKNPN
ncbi:hypothetical protein PIIN_07808 [Serendipita indica DSM 11827]|uniref:Uncharacterized protein n=1 Tax=Serendipita indica (strain DSM 11827) TaxID=1109443 RepID=G4TRB1_SERID|nr:hypothetical protein PIIN_07808 [Serendipita indica DSM 11827]